MRLSRTTCNRLIYSMSLMYISVQVCRIENWTELHFLCELILITANLNNTTTFTFQHVCDRKHNTIHVKVTEVQTSVLKRHDKHHTEQTHLIQTSAGYPGCRSLNFWSHELGLGCTSTSSKALKERPLQLAIQLILNKNLDAVFTNWQLPWLIQL